MNKYEVLYIIDALIEDQARADLIAKFNALITENGGTIEKADEWGKRRLAYPISFKNDGFYVLMNITAKAEFPRELERNFQINESVIRYLVTRIEE